MSQSTNKLIAEQNDRFRKGDQSLPGNVLITQALNCHLLESSLTTQELVQAVQTFDTFTGDNDPYGEHDFGQFTFAGESCYWKIDLYNSALDGGSENPTDPSKTHRVLTIMLAQDY